MFDEDPNDHPVTITHGEMLGVGGQYLDALVGKNVCLTSWMGVLSD